ncbi:probable pectinesterase 55 [Vigna radiata var. radiata]|uniref:pectinesterase n=1 Tax=Vigna radiata var. radiata TaxID=3916 RepID=A0A3Q0ELF0_VIGRR|nr:probable pectinesterase 55 [Vigna radiata var. radiata]
MTPVVAGMISGDRSSFYGVGFYSLQDTLWDDKGRHYFNSCTIEGDMDFIFGVGQSLYEVIISCSISVCEAYPGKAIIGFITAQGRMNVDDENGFVFKNCNIHGFGKTYLGTPWRSYARVLFYKTTMSSIIQPLGWQPWNSSVDGGVEFSEYDNMGPGSALSGRVSWLKKLDSSTLMKMTSTEFVARNGESGEVEKYCGRFLMVATGETSDPFVLAMEALSSFPGKVIHSTRFKSGKEFKDEHVFVVGAENSKREKEER